MRGADDTVTTHAGWSQGYDIRCTEIPRELFDARERLQLQRDELYR